MSDQQAEALLGGRYEIAEELRRTASYRDFVATDTENGRQVLVRELRAPEEDPGFEGRFRAEAEKLKRVVHPCRPRLLEVRAEGGRYFLVLEHLPARPLPDLRSENPEQVQQRAPLWVSQIADLLEHLHGQTEPLVLGEFSPGDIYITRMGRVRVLAMDLERLFAAGPRPGEQLPPGFPLHQDPPSRRAYEDVRCLAKLAYWMLAGEPPPPRRAPAPLDRERCPGVPEAFTRGVCNALDPDYPEPPASVRELRRLLQGHEVVREGSPPRLEFEISELEYIEIQGGKMIHATIRITNRGGGILDGYAQVTQRWVRVNPNTFKGNQAELQVWINSSVMKDAERHTTAITLKTQNQEVHIPVEVLTPPHWLADLPDPIAALVLFLPGLAAFGAACLFLAHAIRKAWAYAQSLAGQGVPVGPEQIAMAGRHPVVAANASIAGLVFLVGAAGVPLAVHLMFRRFPEDQRKLLWWAEYAGMLSPVLIFSAISMRPFFHHPLLGNPDLRGMDFPGLFGEHLFLNLLMTTYLCTPVRALLDSAFHRRGHLRFPVNLGLGAVVLWILIRAVL